MGRRRWLSSSLAGWLILEFHLSFLQEDMLAGMKLKCFKGIFWAHLQRLVWVQIELPLLLHFSKELDKLGAAILDDGMQHLSLFRDLEIVMVNGMIPWGNQKLLPLGPLREPLNALCRADVVVVHHADLASDKNLNAIESMLWKLKESLPIFFSRMAPSYFFKAGDTSCKLPLRTVYNMVVLCVSAIGFASAFVQGIEKIGPLHADRLDFSDHHLFQIKVYLFSHMASLLCLDPTTLCTRTRNIHLTSYIVSSF